MTDLELQCHNTECSSAYWRERVGRETSAVFDITFDAATERETDG